MGTDSLVVAGINHIKAALACRERLALPAGEAAAEAARLKAAAGLAEVVIVSTCSRLEVYASAEDPEAAAGALRSWFIARGGEGARDALYVRIGADALRHLFRVAAGLDSWILGESEILGQVRAAYQAALAARLTGRVLNRAFQSAVAAGKEVRSRTGIQNGIHSIGGAAALLAQRIFKDREGGSVVVFGAGQAAEAVVKHLAAKSFRRIFVANRTLERARAVAAPFGGTAVSFEEGLDLLASVEVAVFSAACPVALLSAERLKPLLRGRDRPLFLIDLGVPRNVEEGCARLDGAYLYDLDDLRDVVKESMEQKGRGREQAEELAGESAEACGKELDKPRPPLCGAAAAQGRGTWGGGLP